MFSSIGLKFSWSGLVWRLQLNKLIQSVAMGMTVFVLAINMGSVLTKSLPDANTHTEKPVSEQHQIDRTSLPRLQHGQVSSSIHHRWMTEAAMTSHNLTAAQFSSARRANQKLSVETKKLTEQG